MLSRFDVLSEAPVVKPVATVGNLNLLCTRKRLAQELQKIHSKLMPVRMSRSPDFIWLFSSQSLWSAIDSIDDSHQGVRREFGLTDCP